MPHAPLVSIIRAHDPNLYESRILNRNNLTYIATRDGVQIGNENTLLVLDQIDDAEEINNAIDQDEMNQFNFTPEEDYTVYMSNRPRSHGLFGNIDTHDLKGVAKAVYNETKNGNIVYRGIISLGEKDGRDLNFTNQEAWEAYLKGAMPDIAKHLNIGVNYTWVAAYHNERLHPHVHFQLWDNSNKIRSPFIHPSTQEKIRRMLSEKMFDNEYEKAVKKQYEKELDELNKTRNESRKELTDLTKLAFEHLNSSDDSVYISYIKKNELSELGQKLFEIVEHLPSSGSIDYQYLPPEVKILVDDFNSTLFKRFDMNNALNIYLDSISSRHKLLGATKTEIRKITEKAYADINKRIGNIVLKHAKQLFSYSDKLEFLSKKKDRKFNDDHNKDFNSTDENFKKEENKQRNSDKKDPFDDIDLDELLEAILKMEQEYREKNQDGGNEEYQSGKYYNDPNTKEYNLKNAIKYFSVSAAKGNHYAKYQLGKIYSDPYKGYYDIQLAIKYYWSASLDGNQFASYRLAMIYYNHNDVPQDMAEVRHNLYKATQPNNTFSNYILGRIYYEGIGEEQDIDKAILNFEKAGNDLADYKLGCIYADSSKGHYDLSKAIEYFELSAESNNAFAQYKLGKIFSDDNSTHFNIDRALFYYEKSAKSGNQLAMYQLGKLYADGKHIEKDLNKAIHYYSMASKNKNTFAEYQLADIYLKGTGVEKDVDKAIKLYSSASEKGNSTATYKLGNIFLEGSEVPQNIDLSLYYFEKAVIQENDTAMYKLGVIYSSGEYLPKNIDKAMHYYDMAVEKGNAHAMYKLSDMYLSGEDVNQDIEKGMHYLDMAAEKGNPIAMYRLGREYFKGEYITPDLDSAVSWLEKASQKDNIFASYELGKIYSSENRYYDMNKAKDKFYHAAEKGNEFAQYQLGLLYKNKETGFYDINKSIYWLHQSALKENEFAQCQLGRIYLFGNEKGVKKDEAMGKFWLQKAAEKNNEGAKQTLEFYEDYKDRLAPHLASKILKNGLFDIMAQAKNPQYQDEQLKTKSKKVQREELIKQGKRLGSEQER